jgi:hypothetical protein
MFIQWFGLWSGPPSPRGNLLSNIYLSLGYGLDDRSSRFRFPAGAGNFSLHHRVQNGFGAQPASYPMGTRGCFPGGKVTGAWSWPLTSMECQGQKMSGAILSLPQSAFMAWCLVKHRDNFTFTFLPFTHLSLRMYWNTGRTCVTYIHTYIHI